MGLIRPATPGFIVTLAAAALLAVVSFCVPYFKSIYFLKATIEVSNVTGSITFGTLGYCLDVPNIATNCSKPSIGYELDINDLVGNKLPVEIPNVAVKWITYALFLHVVALALAVGSAIFGLLAHVREMSMTCCSTCVSGFAAAVAMLAFIFDLVLFFVAKARINSVGKAEMGNAIWLTLAAWLLLFFSGCFYTLGRCCISKRPRAPNSAKWAESGAAPSAARNDYTEQMRLDAVKAEADRKARAKQGEVGLPAFSTNETQPLTARIEGDNVYLDTDDASSKNASVNSKPSQRSLSDRQYAAGGYVQGAPGNRAMDEYYNPTNTYPPQPQSAQAAYGHPQRQGSGYQPSVRQPSRQGSGYSSAPVVGGYGGYSSTSPPPMPSQGLTVPGQGGYNDPYSQGYGHTQGGTSYHTATGHSQQPTAYSGYDAYEQQPTPFSAPPTQQNAQFFSPQPGYTAEPPSFLAPGLVNSASPPPAAGGYNTGYSSPPQQYTGYGGNNDRQYTLSGDGYGASSVPPLPSHDAPSYHYDPYSQQQPEAAMVGATSGGSQMRGPRPAPPHTQSSYPPASVPEDAPPGYAEGTSGVQGRWGKQ